MLSQPLVSNETDRVPKITGQVSSTNAANKEPGFHGADEGSRSSCRPRRVDRNARGKKRVNRHDSWRRR
jgi:hypothetical protein